jgi:hypothetical protein
MQLICTEPKSAESKRFRRNQTPFLRKDYKLLAKSINPRKGNSESTKGKKRKEASGLRKKLKVCSLRKGNKIFMQFALWSEEN